MLVLKQYGTVHVSFPHLMKVCTDVQVNQTGCSIYMEEALYKQSVIRKPVLITGEILYVTEVIRCPQPTLWTFLIEETEPDQGI